MFVDEVRKAMPDDTLLDKIKHNIMEIAKSGGREYTFDRWEKEFELKDEIQWLKDNGFDVKECPSRPAYAYYPSVIVSW